LVYMTPKSDWGGKGLIGVTIRLDDYAMAEDRLIRVLEIEESSPADIAGLHPETDYLLGTSTLSFGSPAVLGQVLRQYENTPLELYVYNTETDMVRVVTLLPTTDWGHDEQDNENEENTNDDADADRGLLGAEVGIGYLHKFPEFCRDTDGSSVELKVVRTLLPQQQVHDIADLTADLDRARAPPYQHDHDAASQLSTSVPAAQASVAVSESAEVGTVPSQQQQSTASSDASFYSRPPAAPATGEMHAMESGERQQQLMPSSAAAAVASSSSAVQPQPQLIPEEQEAANHQPPSGAADTSTRSFPAASAFEVTAEPAAPVPVPSSEGPVEVEVERPIEMEETIFKTTTAPTTAAVTVIATSTAMADESTPPQPPLISTPTPDVQPTSQAETMAPADDTTVDNDADADDTASRSASFTTVDSETLTPVAAAPAAIASEAEHGGWSGESESESNKIHPGLEYEKEEGEEEEYHDDDEEEEYTDDDDEDDHDEEPAPTASSFFGLGKYMPFGRSGGTFTPPVSNGAPAALTATTSTSTSGTVSADADFGMPPPPLSTNK
jgi:hypothetical protein